MTTVIESQTALDVRTEDTQTTLDVASTDTEQCNDLAPKTLRYVGGGVIGFFDV